MTSSLESVRPSGPRSATTEVDTTERSTDGEPSVRQLLAELAHLEDVVRAAGASVDDPAVLTALAREQVIIDELHRRNP